MYTYLWPIQLLIDDFAFDMRLNLDLLCASFIMMRQNLTRESEVGKQSDFFFSDRKVAWFMSLSMPFSQHCGAIYLRSKSYLVFKISSDIMTKHCCQVCVLSMMFCRSDSRLCSGADHDKWWRNRENLSTAWFDTLTGQCRKWHEKYSLLLIFTFYLNRDTSVRELFPVVVF